MTADRYRYPFPPYPTGWYLVGESESLAPGEVRPLRYFGRDLVLFRTAAGEAVLLDANCPHMGAHLGYGGSVDGEGIRCPFHQWRFGVDGRANDVPYLTRGPTPDAGVACWPLHETSGLLLTWFSEHGTAPTWTMPDLPEWGQPGWVGYETVGWKIRMHVQELAENVPDTTHFLYVHKVPVLPEAEVTVDGHVYRQATIGWNPDRSIAWQTHQTAYGLGLIWLRAPESPYVFLSAITPIDDETAELQLLFVTHEGPAATSISPANRAMVDAIAATVFDDVQIWEHKVYRERPALVPDDGPIGVLRKWARQFYEDDGVARLISS